MLWKRDYGGIALDLFGDLRYVADGFFWSRVTGSSTTSTGGCSRRPDAG